MTDQIDQIQPTNPSTDSPTADRFAAISAKLINDTTAVGKGGKVIKWGALASIIVVFLTAIVASPQVFVALHWSIIVVIANFLLVLINGLTDSNTPNV